MNSLNTVIERVYSHINSLTLNDKVKLLSTFTQLSITERDGAFLVDGVSKNVTFTEKYVTDHLRWLRMSEIDNIYNFITKDK